MKNITITILVWAAALLATSFAPAQSLRLQVVDSQQRPIESAIVHLLSLTDSTLLKTEITDADGQIEATVGTAPDFGFVVSALGFQTRRGSVAELVPKGQIRLEVAENALEEVTITARKPMFEVKTDKLVFNVQQSTVSTGNTALELLRKSPGIVVDQSDNIAMRGKNGVRIYIDGKPSPLAGADLAAQLQSMQASDIEAIEIIANPSARFDAAGNAGIINIRLKKDKNLGFNGTVSVGLTQGKYLRNNGNASLNYRNRRFNTFGTYGNNFGRSWDFFDFYRAQNGLVFDQKTNNTRNAQNHNAKWGLDWFLSKKHTLGIGVSGFANRSQSRASTAAPVFLAINTQQPIELLLSKGTREGHRRNLNANINYQWAVGKGKSLSADLDYGAFDLFNEELVPNRYVNVNNTSEVLRSLDFRSLTPTDIRIRSAKADWEQPLGNKNLQMGLKTAGVRTNHTFLFEEDGQPDPTRSNAFTYDERIHAAYAQLARQTETFDWQLGLRAEMTQSEGDLQTDNDIADKNVRRQYLDWFPSAAANWNANAHHRWGVSYSRRIDRPVYSALNPFEYRINELTYSKGNPFLRPQYTHTASVSHTYNWTLTTSLSYSYVNNFFAELSDTIEDRRSFLRTENFDKQEVWNLTTSYPFQLAPWCSGFATATGSHTRYRATFEPGKTIDINNTALSTYAQVTFKAGKRLSLEASGSYSTPSVWGGTYVTRAFWFMDLGAQYRTDRLTLRLVLADVFQSMRWRGVAEFGGLYAVAAGGWDSRQVRLNATYTFGKSTVKKARQRDSAVEDLKGRVH
jgi:iron complex outermembrane recepter protein